ncbi:hypothetical protein HY386_00990 [Candidatus Daviesbacteria bacterium]|nr:hypothetical protein [Candidatus Daviesbacteria bacterium]
MSLLEKLTNFLPFTKTKQQAKHFFALNIGPEKVKAALWSIEDKNLQVVNPVFTKYSSADELLQVADHLLDQTLGDLNVEPEKILFGVPDSWLLDDELKEPYLKLLRNIVKELSLKPMAYVATSHALAHFLESLEGAPTTAILVGIEESFLSITVVRAGKIDGTKLIKRGDNLGEEIEKALLSFTEVEVLPSKILLYGLEGLDKHKSNLLAFPWMSKLSFLHFPKIETLEEDVELTATALAGAVELQGDVKYSPSSSMVTITPQKKLSVMEEEEAEERKPPTKTQNETGFVTGDITKVPEKEEPEEEKPPMIVAEDELLEQPHHARFKLPFLKLSYLRGKNKLLILPAAILILTIFYLLFSQAKVTVFVEPRVLERDSQVTADPNVKTVDEANKIIPGQFTEVQVAGSDKLAATGRKEVGDPAKGTVVIYNKTDSAKTFSSGTALTGSGGLKFTLNSTVNVASQSAIEGGISFGKATTGVTAVLIGADGNISSGTELSLASFSSSQYSAKAEGNFSGGNSKEVTVVTDSDQKKLLASLAAALRKKAQEELQKSLEGKKILEEALSEDIIKKSYSKNINDQASEFSLSLTIKYKGIAYSEPDLKLIVSKLIETNVPADFELNLAETETQADVSKLEKDKLIFLARFKAKLMPKLDIAKIKSQLRGKTPQEVAAILKSYENVLGSDIKLNPSLPAPIARLPLLDRNIHIEVSLK